jgi:cysteine sulfinate desulfinase/cysteine desulfurase-like protein
MGANTERAGSAIRFSLGKLTTEAEIEEAGEIVARVLGRLHGIQSYAVV